VEYTSNRYESWQASERGPLLAARSLLPPPPPPPPPRPGTGRSYWLGFCEPPMGEEGGLRILPGETSSCAQCFIPATRGGGELLAVGIRC